MDNLIISVEEAREILGKEAHSYTDQQIIKLIMLLDEMAKLALQRAKKAVIV
jgi:hypothetical protein